MKDLVQGYQDTQGYIVYQGLILISCFVGFNSVIFSS